MLTCVFESLGRAVARHPRLTVVVWLAITVACGLLALTGAGGQNLFDRLSTGEPVVPGSDSARAAELMRSDDTGASLSLVVTDVDPAADGLAEALEPARNRVVAIDGVETVIDPYLLPQGVDNPAAAPLLARSGDGFLMVVELDPDLSEDARDRALDRVADALAEVPAALREAAPDATGIVGGSSLIVSAITDQVRQDLTTGEAIALPVALLIMVLVFGGFLAAAMPLAGAIASIAGGLGALWGLSYLITDMESSVVNVVTVLGLGLSIDYGLLIVSRFREELTAALGDDQGASNRRRRGDGAVTTALVRTIATAGRTVTFSALTVAVSIAGLLVFRQDILRAFGAGAVAVIVFAVSTALTLVPALLALTGRRLARPGLLARVPVLRGIMARTADVQRDEGAFSRLTARVQRHPWWVMGGSLAVLLVLASPLLHVELRNSTTQLLPLSSPQREYVRILSTEYPDSASPSVQVVTESSVDQAAGTAATLAELPGVASVDDPVTVGHAVLIGVHPEDDDPGSAATQDVVREIRDLDLDVYVGGQAANQMDFVDALAERAPLALGIVALATLILLFLMTGSLLVPIKALLTNAISLCASLGVLVWVFQDGHLSGLLGFESTGGIETYVLALVIAFAFGLAMDYEVFLLSRIKELHDQGVPNDEAVRRGLQRSGRVITSAAAIIVAVFAGFVAGELLVIKEVGFSLAIAVLIDATLVRLLLVPATMTVLREWNWWAPAPLRRIYQRIAITH
ncbi:putative membrane protein [Cellulomonas denverensis]|uniref:MMPL family transporter n=1 Tax=Cellulomonas denverensis TaxID=264297 RepID=A0A7X6KTR9_9CELL|nr:MMPL family transporter [Cellulomonas denverensis]NKY21853.1 MMPL family transporter [Cellulomonas denverensis]GIG24258.1 putative membrane protein [Cellulomonas denverensis]